MESEKSACLVTGIGFIERIISPAADQVKRSARTKGVGMIPGIGDIVSGTSEVRGLEVRFF